MGAERREEGKGRRNRWRRTREKSEMGDVKKKSEKGNENKNEGGR